MFWGCYGSDSLAEFPSLGSKMLARREKSFRDCSVRDADRVAPASALFAKPHHVQSLANMQGAGLAVRTDAIVIEDVIRDVRVLLDFTQHDSRVNRMRGSRGNKNGVARPHGDTLEAILDRAIGDGPAK